MANPFDRFDAPESPASKDTEGRNPFDRFDAPTDSYASIAGHALGGVYRGAAGIVGLPVDFVNGGLNLGYRGVNAAAGHEVVKPVEMPIGGSRSLLRGLGAITGVDIEHMEPRTPTERVAAGAGEGAGMATAGAGVLSGVKSVLGAVAPRTFQMLDAILGKPNVETAAIGAGGGAGGEVAAEMAPEGYKPAARMVGGVVGGLPVVAGRTALGAARYAVDVGREVARPFTARGQEEIAGRKIAGAAADLPAVRESLEEGAHEIVPGSRPTLFQATGDMGLGQVERTVRTQNPAHFIERDAAQNAARLQSLEAVQPTGVPSEVSARFRGLRDTLDRESETTVDRIRHQADQVGAPVNGAVGSAEEHGAALREAAQTARAAAKVREKALWDAVDPEGKMVMPGTPIAETAQAVEKGMSRSAKPLEGEERDIFDVAKSYGEQTPFRDVTDLRSRVSTAMKNELRQSGYSPVYHRLVQLRGSIENAIDNAVENQAALEQRAVAEGKLAPADALDARVQTEKNKLFDKSAALEGHREEHGGGPSAGPFPAIGIPGAGGSADGGPGNVARGPGLPQATGFLPGEPGSAGAPAVARSAAEAGSPASAGESPGAAYGGGPTPGAPAAGGPAAPEGAGAVGLRNAAGAPGVPEAAAVPLDADAAARLKAASASTRYRAVTFDKGPVGAVLKKGDTASEYVASPAQVPAKVFKPGPTGGEAARAYIEAAGPQEAIPRLADYAAFALRDAAMGADGRLNPAKVRAWVDKHGPALDELPPQLRARFTNTARAEEIVRDAVTLRQNQLQAFDRSSLGKIMGLQNDADVVRHVGAIFSNKTAARDMAELAAATQGDPAAREGLRRAVIDHIHSAFLSNTEAGTLEQNMLKSDAFQTFMRTKADVLGKVFDPAEVAHLKNIAEDLQRANRTVTATKLRGGSDTAQNLAGMATDNSQRSVLSRLVFEAAAAGTGSELTGSLVGGAGGWLSAKVAGAFRDAGMRRVDDLVREAMLHPEFARELLKKVPAYPGRDDLAMLMREVRRLAVAGPAIGAASKHDSTELPEMTVRP